jgi:hypothetical protein
MTQEQEARAALEAAYARAGAAYQRKDAATVMATVALGFTQKMPDGTVLTREEAEIGLAEWFKTADAVTQYRVTVGPLALQGGEAVATVDENVTCTFRDPIGGSHERVQANRAQATWIETAEGWKLWRSEYLAAQMTVDGKSAEVFYSRR